MNLIQAVLRTGLSTDNNQAIFASKPFSPDSEAEFCIRKVGGAWEHIPENFHYVASLDLVSQIWLQYPEFTEDEAMYIVYELLGW